MNKKLIFILTLVAFILSIGFVSAEDGDVNGTFTDIQGEVDAASENSVIELDGYYTGDKQVSISKSITIQGKGNGATLDGKNQTRAFTVSKGDVTFKNLIFKNCIANKGGAIYSQGNLIFINCTFKDNYAIDGGAIYSHGNLTVKKTTFINNGAGNLGGAISIDLPLYKTASKSKYGNSNIDDSTFTRNSADRGGAIDVYLSGNLKSSKYGNLNVNNCQFTENFAENYGGAIRFSGEAGYGKLTVKKSKFNKNTANDQGGAIEVYGSDALISGCNFTSNNAKQGALYFYFGGKAIVEKSNFIANNASRTSAVMIYSYDVSLNDCTFKSNSLGVVSFEPDSKLTVTNGKSKTTYTERVVLDNSMKKIVPIVASAKDLTYTYDSDGIFTVTLKNKYNSLPVEYFGIYTKCSGKKTKQFYKQTNTKGVLNLKLNTRLAVGTYKVTFISDDWSTVSSSGITITVKKAKTIAKAPKATAKYKKSNIYKIKVTHKKTKKPVSYVKVKVKVYTGKKAKTYKLTTNENGNAKLNTKKLSRGLHKIVVSSANSNYKISAKSKIKIV